MGQVKFGLHQPNPWAAGRHRSCLRWLPYAEAVLSPYERVLGDRLMDLDPVLARYVQAIPAGAVGRGSGVFAVVGSRRAWATPVFELLERRGIIPAGWYENVPFQIENRTVHGRQTALRTFLLPTGTFTMTDAVHVSPQGHLVDVIGATVAASFIADVRGGGLVLRSDRVGVRMGRLTFRIPRWCSPRVYLYERYDSASDTQKIDLSVTLPVIGTIFEYRGSFTYAVEEDRDA